MPPSRAPPPALARRRLWPALVGPAGGRHTQHQSGAPERGSQQLEITPRGTRCSHKRNMYPPCLSSGPHQQQHTTSKPNTHCNHPLAMCARLEQPPAVSTATHPQQHNIQSQHFKASPTRIPTNHPPAVSSTTTTQPFWGPGACILWHVQRCKTGQDNNTSCQSQPHAPTTHLLFEQHPQVAPRFRVGRLQGHLRYGCGGQAVQFSARQYGDGWEAVQL